MTPRTVLLALALLTAACRSNRRGFEELPSQATPNARVRDGAHAMVLARYFTQPGAITSRVWASPAGAWAFVSVRFTFDDQLNTSFPEGPELLFLPLDGGAVQRRPAPPGLVPSSLPQVQVEAGATLEEEQRDVAQERRSARFVTSAEPALLAIRDQSDGGDRLLRLAPEATAWVVEPLPPEVRELPLREVGPALALTTLPDGAAAMVRESRLVALDTPPASLGAAQSPAWFGPFDGERVRLFWAPAPSQVCTGVWNLATTDGRRDGCVDLNVHHGGMMRAGGTVDETVATLLDLAPLGRRRVLLTSAGPGRFDIKGEGGYGREDSGVFLSRPGVNPVLTEDECALGANPYAVSRHFDADGGFGLVRCPGAALVDACECQRSEDLKGCDCLARSLATTHQFRVGRFSYLQAGWELIDARALLRVGRKDTDTTISTTMDPVDALKPWDGPFSWSRPATLRGLAPGYGVPSSEKADLSHCATVTSPRGPVAMSPDGSFLVDVRDPHTVSLSCQPNDVGPPLEPLVIDASPLLDGGWEHWELTGVGFARGLRLELPAVSAAAVVNPGAAELVATATDGTNELVTLDPMTGQIARHPLPRATGGVTFVPELRLALFGDGKVVDLDTRALLGTLPPGMLAADRQSWMTSGREVWRLERGQAPTPLGAPFPLGQTPLVASASGLVVLRTTAGVVVVDALDRARSALLYPGSPGRILEAGISRDGRHLALLEDALGTDTGRVRVYRRDDLQPTLTYSETTVCTGCGQVLGFVNDTGDVLHLDGQVAGVHVYRPSTSASTRLTNQFPTITTTRLPLDAMGRPWFRAGATFGAWDGASGQALTATVSASPLEPQAQPVQETTGGLFRGVTVGRRVYSVVPAGLELTQERTADAARVVRPLAGGRGWRDEADGLWVGRRSTPPTDLLGAWHAARFLTGAAGGPTSAPEYVNMPCVLVPVGPYPDFVRAPRTNWLCVR
jgi:hypothetical protein